MCSGKISGGDKYQNQAYYAHAYDELMTNFSREAGIEVWNKFENPAVYPEKNNNCYKLYKALVLFEQMGNCIHNINQSDYKGSECNAEHEHNPEAFSDSKIVGGQVRLEFRDYCSKILEDIL